jgi:hypothetical protein
LFEKNTGQAARYWQDLLFKRKRAVKVTTHLQIIPRLRKLRGLCNTRSPGKPGGGGASHRSLNIAPYFGLSMNHGCGAYYGECEIVSVLAVVA